MSDLYNYLTSRGFIEGEANSLVKCILVDFYIKVAPENGNWNRDEDLYIYLYSPSFGLTMTNLFRDEYSPAWDYRPRKFRKDRDGCLGMVLSGIKINPDRIETSKIIPSNFSLTFAEFFGCLDCLKSEKELFYALYKGCFRNFFALVEGAWVYLHFACKLGHSAEKIVSDLYDDNSLEDLRRSWRLRKEIDVDIIKLFFARGVTHQKSNDEE
ncbi:hypothetical protein MLD52_22495 [Puniceicoccaceae bacterium K14]|nr:hypothetical protein [Puniceicoccaceae bacterium K14]